MTAYRSVIVLSTKSSGSSAFQNLLVSKTTVNHIQHTRHFENETLYWTKAASVLGLPQCNMVDSEVPLAATQARRDLCRLLQDNVPGYLPPGDDEQLIYDGWYQLCRRFAPVFLEKSPHHLLQRSALDLICTAMERLPEVDFLLVGLVRNPMDALYSAFQRWRTPPEQAQLEWLEAYHNLRWLQERAGDRLLVLRYEDIVQSVQHLEPVLAFCGTEIAENDRGFFHARSLQRWRSDRRYGFCLAEQVVDLALSYGYQRGELENEPAHGWPLYRVLSRLVYRSLRPPRRAAGLLRRGARRLLAGR